MNGILKLEIEYLNGKKWFGKIYYETKKDKYIIKKERDLLKNIIETIN